eukprot:CAMPEP_0201657740 /NCGR_PEP_ID=MMETSP0494-20130426/880_1 /ASSEMBLY_ACC=CAM_ASM_000839 /TAXON_ID=420259 /ORGANISM="Thalassiosira gravida, Strain GMp14c1" /LENGTH=343 /DNA_ID=CAMNT_0048134633 /DNA_START=15 /DNA_END=1046 /DNA_ORIENTATION=+
MADLDNLLDDINNNDDGIINQEEEPPSPYIGENEDDENDARRSERRRQPDDNDDFTGAGDEERDYQETMGDDDGGDNIIDSDDNHENQDDDDDDDDDDGRNINPEYEQLKGLWTSELACPELLPHDAETVLDAEELTRQEEVIDELLRRSKQQKAQQRMGMGRSSFGGADNGASGELASLAAQITRMDLDRTRFMMVDLARTRMAKIENHALHNRTLVDRMTEEETAYLRAYGELLEKHYRRTVLDHLPKKAWKSLDEPEMIDSPNLEQFVFCRVLETVDIDVRGEPHALNDSDVANGDDNGGGEDDDDFGDMKQEHRAGSYLIVMYKTVRELVLDGKVELLM